MSNLVYNTCVCKENDTSLHAEMKQYDTGNNGIAICYQIEERYSGKRGE